VPLSEEQVVRYSRQILLSDVGGQGQERLLASGAELTGAGGAQGTAAAYLAAGGTPVVPRRAAGSATDVGFPVNADAIGNAVGTVGELPAAFRASGPCVAMGWAGEIGVVVFRSAAGCFDCFENTVGLLTHAEGRAQEVLVGALGALAYQRLALGWSEPVGALEVDARGSVQPRAIECCPEHR
jgi:hypothetical protein